MPKTQTRKPSKRSKATKPKQVPMLPEFDWAEIDGLLGKWEELDGDYGHLDPDSAETFEEIEGVERLEAVCDGLQTACGLSDFIVNTSELISYAQAIVDESNLPDILRIRRT